MKIAIAGIAASLICSAATAATTPGGQQFYGNLSVNGSGACAAVTGIFPASGSYQVDNVSRATTYVLKILIQNSAQGLPLQYIEDIINPNGTYTAYDPQLLGASTASTGVSGTYTGPIGINFVLGVGNSSAPLVLTSQFSAGGQTLTCTLALTGILYFSPD